jgi:hypothetical protein
MEYLKKLFNFLGSIKLAVPTMLILLVCSVTGTILESRYNAEYAGLKIYKTWWFLIVLFFLSVNISFATLTRLPWKKRHVGFLVTHLGMLTLLFGSVLTMVFGIDGTMQIYEGSDSNLVFLGNNVLEIGGNKIPMKRYLDKVNLADIKLNPGLDFTLDRFLPYVDVPEKSFDKGLNLNFKIKSPFFNVVQVLNTEQEREVSMGPATFRLVDAPAVVVPVVKTKKKSEKKVEVKNISGSVFYIKDGSGNVLKQFPLAKKEYVYNGVKFKVANIFKNAQIGNNKIAEGDPAQSNPAVEVQVSQNGKELREIIYQNIPEFSLNPNGLFGFKVGFKLDAKSTDVPMNSPEAGMPMGMGKSGSGDRIKNTVEFQIIDPTKVEVSMWKNGEMLEKKTLAINEMLTTPWMGIELTFLGVKNPTDPYTPTETEPKAKMPLPSSAISLKLKDGKEAWITENSEIGIPSSDGKPASVYYGKERLFLPFSIALKKFEKNDYPGSSMAKDYKSYVQVNGQGSTIEIFMNEPLKFEGYTFYQSSYSLTPNQPALTILSVNRDPGRWFKYIGSIILCMGIITYTLQKSKRFQEKFNL